MPLCNPVAFTLIVPSRSRPSLAAETLYVKAITPKLGSVETWATKLALSPFFVTESKVRAQRITSWEVTSPAATPENPRGLTLLSVIFIAAVAVVPKS